MPSSNDNNEEADFIRELTKHQTAIGAFLSYLLPTHSDIDSLLQEVNVTLWRKKAIYKPGSNFRAWAFQTAKFHALNENRRLKRYRLITLDDAVLETLATSENFDDQIMKRRKSALDSCLTQLNPKERELIKYRYTKKLSIENYATKHNENSGTLRATLRRIRIKLKACINHQLEKNDNR